MANAFVDVLRDAVPLFIIVSPFGAVPLFLSMTATDSPSRRRRTAVFAAVTATATLAGAALAGEAVFAFFGVSLDAFRIAGGVLLFLLSLDMVQMRLPRMKTTDAEVARGSEQTEVGIIPLGIPMLAGPGAIATVLALSSQHPPNTGGTWILLIAIAAVGLASAITLWFAAAAALWLTPVVMGILLRLEGLLLAAIAVQMVITGVQGAFGVR